MEDVNFPLDQGQVTSALRGLRETTEESSRPRRLEDNEEDLSSAEETRDDDVDTASAERTVLREERVDERGQTQRQDQTVADAFSEDQEVEIRDSTSIEAQEGVAAETLQPLEVASEFGIDPRGGAPTPDEQVTEAIRSGNDAADPDRVEEFQGRGQVDSVEEGIQSVNEEAASLEQENPSRPLEGSTSSRDVAEDGRPTQGRDLLDEGFNSEPPSPTDRAAASLEQAQPNDSRIQQRLQEDRAADEEFRAQNEPALETPAQNIDPVEEPPQPLEEAVDNNPLRGPRPSELRDESDATAFETERGQNISNLI